MRRAFVLTLIASAAIGHADRLITIPTARKLPYRTVRYEFRGEPKQIGERENLIGLGIGTAFDMELRLDQEPGERAVDTFDFAYNYISAIPGLTPGLSLGVQDAVDRTADGRRFFGAATFREPFTTINGDVPADITLGVFAGRHWSPFVGVSIPFSKEFHLLVEHNGFRISSGIEYQVSSLLNLRAQVRDHQTLLSLQLTRRF
ncbi:hypothetical protein [Fimbriimonas ginsengisoli]|uniref:Outer membrane protein beta-barrel domain-containing protein n=1 Tax=Fimbriimonas ginsengisoli Gsoil 348 TaxID=661478 RepID=A0A068NL27_FIMGI|nr:hypothetical protein [Fimbriimonas ginsengisoli]AIE84288.1 hypothetical protein OP10G_0920 [Fimbriimonas ginsengisoli Gsoil 348]